MKILAILFLVYSLQGDVIPLKPKDEFNLKVNMEFRSRQLDQPAVVYSTENIRRSSGPLPYLQFDLALLKLPDGESRIRVVNNENETVLSKKIGIGDVLKLDMGYTDDLKGHRQGCAYNILLLNAQKKANSRIVIHFEEDGTYLVNGEKRGKI